MICTFFCDRSSMFRCQAFDDIPANPVVDPGIYFNQDETKNGGEKGLTDLCFEPARYGNPQPSFFSGFSLPAYVLPSSSVLSRRPPARRQSGRRRRRGLHRRSPPSPELRPFAFSSIELPAAGVFVPPPVFGSRRRPPAVVDRLPASPPQVTAVFITADCVVGFPRVAFSFSLLLFAASYSRLRPHFRTWPYRDCLRPPSAGSRHRLRPPSTAACLHRR
jgi:hypothetical protein